MSYRPKAIIFTSLICLLLMLTMTALASESTAALQEGGEVVFSAETTDAKPQTASPPASLASSVYLPILYTPTVMQLDFAGSTDCTNIAGSPQPAPATFNQPLRQLLVLITLDGLQGQPYTYTWFRDGSFLLNGVQNVSPVGADVKSITIGTACDTDLPSGVYRLDVSQLGTVILSGTATLP